MLKIKFLSALLSVCLLLSVCGCRQIGGEESLVSSAPSTDSQETAGGRIQLLYSYSDTFNPYTAGTDLNRELCSLLYDPLVRVDNEFNQVMCLAEQVTLEGTDCTVRIKSVTFSDGSAVTAEDVIYSYNAAKNSANEFAHRFYGVASVLAESISVVKFRLNRRDPYFVSLLDFPIIKSGSDKTTSTDGVAAVPIGCGRYTVNSERTALSVNKGYYRYDASLRDIELINAPDGDAVSHYVEVGASDVYYSSLSGGDIVRMSGKKTDINLNNLVYIGINNDYSGLKNKYMRYAISSALDRGSICNQAYYNNAVAATGFFSPAFKDTSARQTLEKNTNLEITIENLNKIGYNRLNSSGYRVNSSGNHPSFTLLVNSDNASRLAAAELISQQLRAAGIELRVISQPFEQYKASLEGGAFQLYLGEIKLQNNMDISPLVIEGGSAAYGVSKKKPEDSETADKTLENSEEQGTDNSEPEPAIAISYSDMLSRFYAGDEGITIGDIAGSLLTEMPQIPVCYRLGLVFYDGKDVNCENACEGDIYFAMRVINKASTTNK